MLKETLQIVLRSNNDLYVKADRNFIIVNLQHIVFFLQTSVIMSCAIPAISVAFFLEEHIGSWR